MNTNAFCKVILSEKASRKTQNQVKNNKLDAHGCIFVRKDTPQITNIPSFLVKTNSWSGWLPEEEVTLDFHVICFESPFEKENLWGLVTSHGTQVFNVKILNEGSPHEGKLWQVFKEDVIKEMHVDEL